MPLFSSTISPHTIQDRMIQLQIKTKRLLRGAHTGSYVTRKIGTGSEFDQLRDYQVGDNVRAIDWKSSARSNKLIVRSYQEDRNRTIVLMIDNSRSGLFASGEQLKTTVIQELAIIISFAAEQSRDRIGALFFHQALEKVIPLGTGKNHCAHMVNEIAQLQPVSVQTAPTSLAHACISVFEHFPPQALVVIISDGLSNSNEQLLAAIAQRNEVVFLRVIDPLEREIPAGLLIRFQDPETGIMIESTDPASMEAVRAFAMQWYTNQERLFKKLGIDYCDIILGRIYDDVLMRFFAQRCL